MKNPPFLFLFFPTKITNSSWSNRHVSGGQEGPAASPEALRDAWPKMAGCSGPGWDPDLLLLRKYFNVWLRALTWGVNFFGPSQKVFGSIGRLFHGCSWMWMNWAYGFWMCKKWIWMHVHRLPQMHKYPNISKWRWNIYPNISKYCKYKVAGWEMDRHGQSIPIYRWYPAGLRYPCWSHNPVFWCRKTHRRFNRFL